MLNIVAGANAGHGQWSLFTRAPGVMISLLLTASLGLSGCAGVSQPFGKPENNGPVSSTLVPPEEAFKPAGPGAEKDIDYETVYGPGVVPPDTAGVLGEESEGSDLASAEGKTSPGPSQSKAASSRKREIRAVAVVSVKGAPGRGNAELTDAMRATLREAGWPVVGEPQEDALTIAGNVRMSPPRGEAQNVSLSWTVSAYDGTVLGTIKQANDVPAGSLNKSWGQAAQYAAEAGATGIFDLIKRYR